MHKAGKSSKGYGFDVDNTIGRYSMPSSLKLSLLFQLSFLSFIMSDKNPCKSTEKLIETTQPTNCQLILTN